MTFFPPPRVRPSGDPTLVARSAFAAEAERAFRRAWPRVAVRYETADFALAWDVEERLHKVFLENTFVETREMTPEERRARVEALVASAFASEKVRVWEDVRDRLVPVLRASSMFVAAAARAPTAKPDFVGRPFAPFLGAYLAIDAPESMQYVCGEELTGWGVSAEEAFARAFASLAAHDARHGVEPYDRDASYPIWHVAVRDSYESSRLLLPGWLASFAGRVHGRPIAIVPERGQLIVSGDGDPAAITRLLATAERESAASTRSISPAIYGVDDRGAVIPYVAPRGHALYGRTCCAHYLLAFNEYRDQKRALDAEHAASRADVSVAAYFAIEHEKTEEPLSYAAWDMAKETLLPIADYVALPRPDGSPFLVRWDTFCALAGAHLRDVPGRVPVRVRASGTPSRSLMAQLEAAATPI